MARNTALTIACGAMVLNALGCRSEAELSREVGQRDAQRQCVKLIGAILQLESDLSKPLSSAEILAIIKKEANSTSIAPCISAHLARGEDALGGPLTILTSPEEILVITAIHRIGAAESQFAVRIKIGELGEEVLDSANEIAAARARVTK